MLRLQFITAMTLRLMSSSALTRSRSEWSMMAISPGLRRLVMFLVRRSTRATAVMPGGTSALSRPTSGIFTDGTFIEFHTARTVTRGPPGPRLRRVMTFDQYVIDAHAPCASYHLNLRGTSKIGRASYRILLQMWTVDR